MLIVGSISASTATLYETNFFGSAQGVSSFNSTDSTHFTFSSQMTGGYSNNPYNGGPADVVLSPQNNHLLVSDYGDGKIYDYTNNLKSTPTIYGTLAAGTAPVYMASFSSSGVIASAAVPEPTSLALLGLGAAAGLVARRRLRRARSAG
jgi:hypothetical protein